MSLTAYSEAAAPVVGVDIGGTKTEIRLARRDGTRLVKLRETVLPSHSWRGACVAEDAANLLAQVHLLIGDEPIAALGVGAHGCDDDGECEALAAALRARSPLPLRVVNDAELMPLAMGRVGQIGLVAGTGSIAVCRDAEGRMISAGGWGWLIGDDGSAAGLVREAARAVAVALDAGATTEDPLIRLMYASLGQPDLPRLGSTLASLGSAAAIGAHAPAVFDACDEGSPLAAAVIRAGAEALAELVMNLQVRGSTASHVVAGGSVIVSQPPLWRAFAAAVAQRSEGQITPHLFNGHPVEGACRLAADLVTPALS
ncbi:sugar kinase [Rhodobacter sphaeroides]|jgi:Predicted N-acetylglucosamine kinase|uniref:Sugar kinase n=1 Tax=Cereibacter sphaeroides (strain ATCC 17023 / DSM 158 / JCM 6121 / CCUG 31486 / LMG 2827 / NBRC 12203 / NCIMB 8253 / ATH 2.4.1.) TaxID=272943 RepID=Q3J6J7_CERS4|nr:BadF/BadG/BcrA/BcrD ATPase family protein [Cereibacter sphaeroides]ABA77587.1 Putative sugar kinase [Cereibacter sphaeroides 2.4.1]AMJ45991.1 sugar kinase [Cereibacter sphaeroides]ANS32702.1 sugar kinase [Cereibacter sphaeroides]ATN61755.1 sugar kinase [Cereibacter sphaeroides]AXC59837.1 sugar kinase [Cereibacter sphaeroides 2.4.1]